MVGLFPFLTLLLEHDLYSSGLMFLGDSSESGIQSLCSVPLHLPSTVRPLIVLLSSPAPRSYSLLGVRGVSSLLMQVGSRMGEQLLFDFRSSFSEVLSCVIPSSPESDLWIPVSVATSNLSLFPLPMKTQLLLALNFPSRVNVQLTSLCPFFHRSSVLIAI